MGWPVGLYLLSMQSWSGQIGYGWFWEDFLLYFTCFLVYFVKIGPWEASQTLYFKCNVPPKKFLKNFVCHYNCFCFCSYYAVSIKSVLYWCASRYLIMVIFIDIVFLIILIWDHNLVELFYIYVYMIPMLEHFEVIQKGWYLVLLD